jgi:hypothetical protein
MTFKVRIRENSHYMDESEAYEHGCGRSVGAGPRPARIDARI